MYIESTRWPRLTSPDSVCRCPWLSERRRWPAHNRIFCGSGHQSSSGSQIQCLLLTHYVGYPHDHRQCSRWVLQYKGLKSNIEKRNWLPKKTKKQWGFLCVDFKVHSYCDVCMVAHVQQFLAASERIFLWSTSPFSCLGYESARQTVTVEKDSMVEANFVLKREKNITIDYHNYTSMVAMLRNSTTKCPDFTNLTR